MLMFFNRSIEFMYFFYQPVLPNPLAVLLIHHECIAYFGHIAYSVVKALI